MRILLLSTSSHGGGAAEAVSRLALALKEVGQEVRVLTLYGDGTEDEERQSVLPSNHFGKLRALYLKARERVDIVSRNAYIPAPLWCFSAGTRGVDISRHPFVLWADVIHLHWVNQGFLSIRSLKKLQSLGKPLLWTLHDLWAVTGGCHIPIDHQASTHSLCPRYTEGCGYCPLLKNRGDRDYSKQIQERKQFLHSLSEPIEYIAVSRGVAEAFARSPLRQGLPLPTVIAPPITLDDCKPITVDIPGYSTDKDYLLLVAARLDDIIKGPHLLVELSRALARMGETRERSIEFVLVGSVSKPDTYRDMALPTHFLGRRSRGELAYLYKEVASLTLSTSLFETFGQTLTESLSYGTPIIAFSTYGPQIIVQEGYNGYLARPYDTAEMASLVCRLLDECRSGRFTAAACRASLADFAPRYVAEQHIQLYEKALRERALPD